MKNEELYMTSKEVIDLLRISPSTLRRMMRKGIIKPIKLSSRKNLYKRSDIEKLLQIKIKEEE